jgi:hypothetical protein
MGRMAVLKGIKMNLSQLTIAIASSLFSYSALAATTDHNFYSNYNNQAESIYAKMTIDECIGQLLLPSYVLLAETVSTHGEQCKTIINKANSTDASIIKACGLDQIKQYHLGAVLTGGGPFYNAPTLKNWAKLNQLAASQHRLGSSNDPLLLTGNDAIHGNMHVQGAVIFPHNIGLGVLASE